MPPGSYLVNASRGHVVDIESLAAALRDQHLAGAALDVFPQEPKSAAERFEAPLRGLPNTILTPHIAASTAEARIGDEVAQKLVAYSYVGATIAVLLECLPGHHADGNSSATTNKRFMASGFRWTKAAIASGLGGLSFIRWTTAGRPDRYARLNDGASPTEEEPGCPGRGRSRLFRDRGQKWCWRWHVVPVQCPAGLDQDSHA